MIPKNLLCRIPVLNRQRKYKIDRQAVAWFCAELLQILDMPDRALSVVFLDAREMRSINRKYRGKDYATDVLSFSYTGVSMEGTSFIGEIIIAPEVAINQAARYGIRPERELRKLIVHGTLHLMGYDHETDRGQMNRMQGKLMRRKFFNAPPCLAQMKVTG